MDERKIKEHIKKDLKSSLYSSKLKKAALGGISVFVPAFASLFLVCKSRHKKFVVNNGEKRS